MPGDIALDGIDDGTVLGGDDDAGLLKRARGMEHDIAHVWGELAQIDVELDGRRGDELVPVSYGPRRSHG